MVIDQQFGTRLVNRITAIRKAAKRPTVDFNLDWQLRCLTDEIEAVFVLRSSQMDELLTDTKASS